MDLSLPETLESLLARESGIQNKVSPEDCFGALVAGSASSLICSRKVKLGFDLKSLVLGPLVEVWWIS